jgi:magnesium chelatase family protein
MTSKEIDKFIVMEDTAEQFLKNTAKKLDLSPRVIHRIMKIARTIADYE